MSISANTVWEVRPTNGVDTNGGGFVTGAAGTDFSQQNAKNTTGTNISTTDGVGVGTTTWTSITGNFTSALVGNIIYLSGSGITTGRYQVTAVGSSTSITLDRNPGTGTGATMNIGGALKTLGQLITNFVNGNNAWVKAEATISIASGINFNFTSNEVFSFIAGYTSTRGDGGQVTLQASSTGFTMLTLNNNNSTNTTQIRNFILDCNTKTSVQGASMQSNGCIFDNITVKNQQGGTCFNLQNNGSNSGTLRNCTAMSSDNVTGFQDGSGVRNLLIRCVATGFTSSAGTSSGFQCTEGTYIQCIAANNAGSTCDGFVINSGAGAYTFLDCVAYNNGRHGWFFTSGFSIAYPILMENCIAALNGGWGILNSLNSSPDPNNGGLMINFMAFFSNTSGNISGITSPATMVSLTGDPFVSGSGNNFQLNATAGAGAACRAAGTPGPYLSGTGFEDIGVLQHQDSGGSAGMLYVPNLEGT